MSDSTQRVLPIFPLTLVQLPGAITPLHIFEERYRKMLRDVMLADKSFGIVYRSDEPDTGTGAPPLGGVGCAVQVMTLQPMPDGRANILCAGGRRFRLRAYVEGEPYLQAEVEFFGDAAGDDLGPEAAHAASLFKRVVAANQKLKGGGAERAEEPELPEEPEALSFIIAASLDLKPEEKQALLEMTVTADRLSHLTSLLERLVTAYERRAAAQGLARHNGHGGGLPA